jgi:predicted Na+-dependent transporter
LLALLANFIVMPLGALALDKMLALDEPLGLLLLGASAGAPFLPKLTEFAKGAILAAGGHCRFSEDAGWLFLVTLLPLAGGLALRSC